MDGEAGVVHAHQEERNGVVLASVGVGAGAHPVPVGEVRRGGEHFLPIEQPAVVLALGLEAHRSGVRAGAGLGVTHREFNRGVQDLGQELGLQLVIADLDQCLADDADALADLRRAHGRQLLVEQIFVKTLAILTATLLGPGDAQPAAGGEFLHEGAALGRVAHLRHVLARYVHYVRVVILDEELIDLAQKFALLFRKLKIHDCPLGDS